MVQKWCLTALPFKKSVIEQGERRIKQTIMGHNKYENISPASPPQELTRLRIWANGSFFFCTSCRAKVTNWYPFLWKRNADLSEKIRCFFLPGVCSLTTELWNFTTDCGILKTYPVHVLISCLGLCYKKMATGATLVRKNSIISDRNLKF